MSLTKRIIPCLDVHEGWVVKGVHFQNLRQMGDPVELGLYYEEVRRMNWCTWTFRPRWKGGEPLRQR